MNEQGETMIEKLIAKLNQQRADLADVVAWLAEQDLAGFYVHEPPSGVGVMIQAQDAEQMAAAVRIIAAGAPLGSITKTYADEIASCTRTFGTATVKVYALRRSVCEKVVVGVETVLVPDPDAPMVTVEREVTEWVCGSLLAGSEDS